MKKLILLITIVFSGIYLQAQVKDSPFNEANVILITISNVNIDQAVSEIEDVLAEKFIFIKNKRINNQKAFIKSDEFWVTKTKTLIHAIVMVSFNQNDANVDIEITGDLWYLGAGQWPYPQPVCYKTNAGSNSGKVFTIIDDAFRNYKKNYRRDI